MPKKTVTKLNGRGVCIIDADVDIFRAAMVEPRRGIEVVGIEDTTFKTTSMEMLVSELKSIFEHYRQQTKCASYVLMLSGSTERNWRKKLLPTYKEQRKKIEKPALIGPLREALLNDPEVAVHQRINLEGDDLCGIFATQYKGKGTRTVIVSIDKDMKTIPGNHYNPDKAEDGVYKVSPRAAALYHMTQALTGDTTDNYKGCPGIGPKKAAKLLAEATSAPYDEYVKELWKIVVDTFEMKGYRKEDALIQARVACILQNRNWNSETKRIKLWTP